MDKNIYTPIQQVRDKQPIRATCFHPSGQTYVVGTNSKTLKICKYPDAQRIQDLLDEDGVICEPEIAFTCLHIHCASVYCTSFNHSGDLLATGSNDQIVHVVRYDVDKHVPQGSEYKLSMHGGTVRDVCFLQQASNDGSSLLSAGGGDFEIRLTDCNIMKSKQTFRNHKSTVMSLHSCSDSAHTFVSGGLDGLINIWDVRCQEPVANVSYTSKLSSILAPDGDKDRDTTFNDLNLSNDQTNFQMDGEKNQISSNNDYQNVIVEKTNGLGEKVIPVGVVRLDPTGRLLVSGHQDGSCMLYDIRADCVIQSFKAHSDEIRTLNLSPNSHYLLTGSYDHTVRLFDIQGHLNNSLPSIEVAALKDKIVQTAWHPVDYNFVTTCADGSATLWAIPDFEEWLRDSLLVD